MTTRKCTHTFSAADLDTKAPMRQLLALINDDSHCSGTRMRDCYRMLNYSYLAASNWTTMPFCTRRCKAARLSSALRLDAMPWYHPSARKAFHDRFNTGPGDMVLPVQPVPWLAVPSQRHGEAPTEFWGNNYLDLYLFYHYFATPTPLKRGTYVEIGADNGLWASNTLFFEQR